MRRPLLFLGGAQYLSVFKVEQLRALAFSLGWLAFLSPPLADYLWPYIAAPGILGEGSLTLWLLVVGVNVQRWKEQASTAPIE